MQLSEENAKNMKASQLLLPLPTNTMNTEIIDIPKINIGRPRTQPISSETDRVLSSSLTDKIVGDVLVAAGITFGFSPFLAVLDKAITQRAAGTHTIAKSSMETISFIARNPIAFVKSPSFIMMWGVYAATYTTANCLKTVVEHNEHMERRAQEESTRKMLSNGDNTRTAISKMGTTATFLGTTIVNSTTSILKDRAYARMFGTSSLASKVPVITYGLWASRDAMVMGSSFVLPEMVSETLKEGTSMTKQDALRLSQFLCPVLTQVFASPLQLLGLDFYNRPLREMSFGKTIFERSRFVGQNFSSVTAARVARMAPAYGIGGIGNTYFRNEWRNMLIRREMKNMDETSTDQDRRESARNLVDLVVAGERDSRERDQGI
mmetsp:Transcript_8437/g.11334  ORF Transcript_8437/g.11334 Transcript_8437/m.11334 type:complete len:378 (-) Transcript_8437:384-1517(-)